MKFLTYSLFFAALVALVACNKELDLNNDIAAYQFATLDEDAGTWKPIVLASGDAVALEAPLDVTSSAYQTELADLKSATQNLSAEQLAAIEYWGANAAVRWNEIARELISKYNLPPAPNADGTYSAPNSMDPGTYPYFPFANPPYTCRAFAYLSTAQYDGLISAWHYKKAYNRPAPYTTDTSIPTALPTNSLPSYPSEDAVIATISQKVLTAMFPLEAEFIAQKAAEHRNSRTWAGMNTASDLVAGDSLGSRVAAVFLARAKGDGMKNAIGSPQIADSLATVAQTNFGWHWESMESPKRPGMLPVFGKVKPWCLSDITVVRPGPPPALTSTEFQVAADELLNLSENLTNEQRRIAVYWGDGIDTYAPPGHWNRTAAELIVEKKMNPIRTVRTLAYLNMAVEDAGISCWDTKYFYHYPRPSQAIAGFKSLLGLPNFPSYTSGHSTFSGAAATVLGHIFPDYASEMTSLATEASESRIYGGIHYRFDCEVGLVVGQSIGNYAVAIAQVDGAE